MSLLDQIEKQLIDRLKELEPLRREYERLRKAAERMGIKYSPTASEPPATAQREDPAVVVLQVAAVEHRGRHDRERAARR